MRERHVLEHYSPEDGGISELLHRIKDLNPRQTSFGVVIGSNAVREMLGRYRGLAKANVKGIHLLVVSDCHCGSFKNSTRKRKTLTRVTRQSRRAGLRRLRQSPISRHLRTAL